MNITIEGRSLTVHGEVIATDEYTNRAGVEAILQAWTDRPSRTWMPSPGGVYVVAQQDDSGRTDVATILATDDDLYSLAALATIVGDLAWAEGIGEPSLEDQATILADLRSRVESGGLPQTLESLEELVLLVIGATR